MSCSTHCRIHKAAGPQFFFSTEMIKRIEVTCRLCGQRCLKTDAKGSPRARILYQHKKRNGRDTGVTTENTASKAIADRILDSAQIAFDVCANRTRARIRKSIRIQSYLATKWQRGGINARCALRGRRFPTPQPATNHLLLQRPPKTAGALLPISQPNPNFLRDNCTKRAEGGRGGDQRRNRRKLRIDTLACNFLPNRLPAPFLLLSKKRASEPLRDSDPSRPALSRELVANHR